MLFAGLISVDDRVRQQVGLRLTGATARDELHSAGVQLHDLLTVIIEAARYHSIEHAPMMLFVLAASILFVFMLRT